MKFICTSCPREIDVDSGQSPPPWCSGCGSDLKADAVQSPVQDSPVQNDRSPSPVSAAHVASAVSERSNKVRLESCPGCAAQIAIEHGQARPPWCPQCGEDFKTSPAPRAAEPTHRPAPRVPEPMGRSQSRSEHSQSPATDQTRPVTAPVTIPQSPVESAVQPSDCSDQTPTAADAWSNSYLAARQDDDVVGRDERFTRHNLLVGAGLGIWGFVMATGMAGSPDQEILDSHPSLMSIIDMLQVFTFLNGIALFVSGLGLRRRQSWGYRLAAASAVVSILGGIAFLAVWMILIQSSRGGEIVQAVAAMTFVRTNIDLLIGLVDGGALIAFLARNRPRSTAAKSSGRGHAPRYATARS